MRFARSRGRDQWFERGHSLITTVAYRMRLEDHLLQRLVAPSWEQCPYDPGRAVWIFALAADLEESHLTSSSIFVGECSNVDTLVSNEPFDTCTLALYMKSE